MKNNFWRSSSLIAAFMLLTSAVFAQETKPSQSPTPNTQKSQMPQAEMPPAANPADVASIDAIIKSIYNVISGDAGVKRDWNRFRSLFYPGARLIPTGKSKEGNIGGRVITPEDYIKSSAPFLEEKGFHEREIARRIEEYGNIAHVFTTYESKNKLTDEKPFMRGINSIQLLNDGTRWWVLTILWSPETPDAPLPKKYLNN